MPSNKPCGSPAVKGQLFCHNHKRVRAVTGYRRRNANDYTYVIPFVFPEDRAAINYNLFLVNKALTEQRIDTRTANAMTANIRAAAINLARGPLLEPDTEETVKRVILTPEGDEIAPPREVLEQNESPIHYKDCPCRRCAEQFRGAPPEQHHADCKCGLCEPIVDTSDQIQGCHPERSEGPASSDPATDLGAPSLEPAATKVGNHESSPGDKQASVTKREASAQALSSADILDPIQKVPDYHNYLYGDEIAKHEAQHAARARAALEAGLEPPEHKPWDTSIKAAERERKREEWKAGIDQRRKESIDKWNAEHPDQPKEFKPSLTWGEEHDLKLAEMKRPREQDEARLRGQSLPAS